MKYFHKMRLICMVIIKVHNIAIHRLNDLNHEDFYWI